jgi:hypothetical protein
VISGAKLHHYNPVIWNPGLTAHRLRKAAEGFGAAALYPPDFIAGCASGIPCRSRGITTGNQYRVIGTIADYPVHEAGTVGSFPVINGAGRPLEQGTPASKALHTGCFPVVSTS